MSGEWKGKYYSEENTEYLIIFTRDSTASVSKNGKTASEWSYTFSGDMIKFPNNSSVEAREVRKVSDKLIGKIEKNLTKCTWLNYDHFNHNVLNYYIECNILDNDPCQKDYTMIPGIDLALLRKNRKVRLTDDQAKRVIDDIYHYDLFEWCKTNFDYVNDWIAECGSSGDIIKDIQGGQYQQISEELYQNMEEMLLLFTYNYLYVNEIILNDEQLEELERDINQVQTIKRDLDNYIHSSTRQPYTIIVSKISFIVSILASVLSAKFNATASTSAGFFGEPNSSSP